MRHFGLIAVGVIFAAVAGCSSAASHPSAASYSAAVRSTSSSASFTDANGYKCTLTQAQAHGGYCPKDPLVAAAQQTAAAPQSTDPNGQTCSSLDSLGYCPGDDPSPPLACSTVIDPTGWSNGPLTEVRAIAVVAGVMAQDGANLIAGNASNTDLHLLDNMESELNDPGGQQYAGKLFTDSQQFATDEQSYNPGGTDFGPEDTAYTEQMFKDIIILIKDCPGEAALQKQMLGSQ